MRLEKDIIESGYFWLPGKADNKIPGTLKIVDGGFVQLELIGEFFEYKGEGLLEYFQKLESHIPEIIGNLCDKRVRLIDGENTQNLPKLPSFFISLTFVFKRAVILDTVEEDECLSFKVVDFSINGLVEWFEFSNITVKNSTDLKTVSMNGVSPDDLMFNLSESINMQVKFKLLCEVGKFGNVITKSVRISLEFKDPVSLDEVIKNIHLIGRFFNFLFDRVTYLYDVKLLSKDNQSGSLFYESLFFDKKEFNFGLSLIFYIDIKDSFESLLKNWIELNTKFGICVNLFFAAKFYSPQYPSGRFLYLAQCLEAFHKMKSNLKEMIFKERIQCLQTTLVLSDTFSCLKSHEFSIMILKGRNRLTHYDEESSELLKEKGYFFNLFNKVDLFMQLLFCKELGLSNEQLNEILKEKKIVSYKLDNKLE
jgi:hypothetical protein